jgi:hypothetical protein
LQEAFKAMTVGPQPRPGFISLRTMCQFRKEKTCLRALNTAMVGAVTHHQVTSGSQEAANRAKDKCRHYAERTQMQQGPICSHIFGRVLDDATNSYKFFWTQSLLSVAHTKGDQPVSVREMIARTLAAAWHTVLLFKLSLGRNDKLRDAISKVQRENGLAVRERYPLVLHAIMEAPVLNELADRLSRYVPTRFLTPWFESDLQGLPDHQKDERICSLAAEAFKQPGSVPYVLEWQGDGAFLRIDPIWRDWMRENAVILGAFADQRLTQFLQSRNPGVPGIHLKLRAPTKRDMTRGRAFWKAVAKAMVEHSENLEIRDIYSGLRLGSNFDIDHFLPWSFVVHDQLWNLVPVSQSTNSAKSDCLPDLQRYLPAFAALHREALHALQANPSLLADHVEFFSEDLATLLQKDVDWFKERYAEKLRPLSELARLQGFRAAWTL